MSEKRLAIVTGAARGIGKCVVMKLLEQGRIVAAIDLLDEQLKELEAAVKETGKSVITRCCDITETEKFMKVLEELADEHGGIGILVNNAGITRDNLLMRMSDEEFDKVIAVNLRAAFVAMRTVSRYMVRNKWGRIISLSSVSGVMGNAGQVNYAASKAGLIGMTKTVARELARKNVTANCVAPGFIETEMTAGLPIRRSGITCFAASFTCSGSPAVISVSINPGATQFAVTFFLASSRATVLVIPISPALLAA